MAKPKLVVAATKKGERGETTDDAPEKKEHTGDQTPSGLLMECSGLCHGVCITQPEKKTSASAERIK